jgi:glycosyltransferase involved in cell wall biosynthesis
MKIAFIFPRFTGPYGGEKYVISLANEIVRLGHEVSIITQRRMAKCDVRFSKEVQIISLDTLKFRDHNIVTFLDWILMIRVALRVKKDFEVVAPMIWQSILGGALAKQIFGVKVVYHCFEPPRFLYDLKEFTFTNVKLLGKLLLAALIPLVRIIDTWAVKRADAIISISDWTAGEVERIYGLRSEIVYPGIEAERFLKYTKEQARKELGIPSSLKVYTSASKLHRRKRIDRAIDVFQEHLNNTEDGIFYIIGSGPHEDDIRDIVSRKKLRNVRVLGEVDEEMIPLYLNASDYFVFTAVNEPFGIAPLEAKVAGCKVIPEPPRYPVVSWREHASRVLSVYRAVSG